MKTFFTSDWHLGEDRIGINGKPNLFYRPFTDITDQDDTIIDNFNEEFKNGDTLYHLGDVIYKNSDRAKQYFGWLREDFPDSKFHLIIGNYDEDKLDILEDYFDSMVRETTLAIRGRRYYLNHYPTNCIDKSFSITGHIHSLWKVQKNMINVGVDAWHFKPVSEDEIDFCRTACEKYYDKNVFPY